MTGTARGGKISAARLRATSTLDALEQGRAWSFVETLSAVSTWSLPRHTTTTLGRVWFVWQPEPPPRTSGGRLWGPGTQWTLFVTTLSDERFEVVTPFPVRIAQPDEESFVAEFPEANVAMAGETAADAYDRLIENLVDVFDLYSHEEKTLGPEPARQLSVLRKYIARRP